MAQTRLKTLAICAYGLFFGALAQGEEHTLTDIQGREIEARIVSVQNDAVTLIRIADGERFTLPLTKLSDADQTFLADWETRRFQPSPDWKWVRIHMDLPNDEVEAVGIRNAFRRIGASLWEGFIPVGSWLHLNIKRNEMIGTTSKKVLRHSNFLLRYDGSPEWKLLLKEKKKLYRITQESGEQRPQLIGLRLHPRAMNGKRVPIKYEQILSENLAPEGVSVDLAWGETEEFAEKFTHPVSGMTIDALHSKPFVTHMDQLKPKAILFYEDGELMADVAKIAELECLYIRRFSNSKDIPPTAEQFAALSQAPNLRTFDFHFGDIPVRSFRFLDELNQVKWLYLRGVFRNPSPNQREGGPYPIEIPHLTGLEALSFDRGARLRITNFDPDKLQGLHSLQLPSESLKLDLPLFQLPKLCSMSMDGLGDGFDNRDGERDIYRAKVRDLLESKTLPNLRQIDHAQVFDASALPHLQHLSLERPEEFLEAMTLERSTSLTWLSSMYSSFDEEELEKMAGAKAFERVEFLHLDRPRTESLDSIANFPGLRGLSIFGYSSHAVTFDYVNLHALPNLDCLFLDGVKISNIIGIPDHRNLRYLRLEHCNEIQSLEDEGGEPEPNQSLVSVFINFCRSLTNINAFSELENVRSFHLNGCKAIPIESVQEVIQELRQLDYYLGPNGQDPQRWE